MGLDFGDECKASLSPLSPLTLSPHSPLTLSPLSPATLLSLDTLDRCCVAKMGLDVGDECNPIFIFR